VNLKLEKTTLAMQFAVNLRPSKASKCFLLTATTHSTLKGLSQISGDRFDEVAERIILVKPKDFRGANSRCPTGIQDYATSNVGLIIFDTFTSLYSAKFCEHQAKRRRLVLTVN